MSIFAHSIEKGVDAEFIEELFDAAFQNLEIGMSNLGGDEMNPAASESLQVKKPVILSSPPPQKLNMVQIPKLKVHQENENVTESVNDSNLNVDDIILEESSVESEMINFTNLNFSDLKSA